MRINYAAAPYFRPSFWGGMQLSEDSKPLLIKRYASRRLYNTETSDYVTLDDIAGFIRAGRDVQIIDLKSGDDLTRQYLLQIIADHESRGENVLPLGVLNDLVRSYSTKAGSVVPQFLQASFDMLRDGQSKAMENMNTINPMNKIPGFEAMQAQQAAFLKAMTGGLTGGVANVFGGGSKPSATEETNGDDLNEIKQQLADLQAKLSKMSK